MRELEGRQQIHRQRELDSVRAEPAPCEVTTGIVNEHIEACCPRTDFRREPPHVRLGAEVGHEDRDRVVPGLSAQLGFDLLRLLGVPPDADHAQPEAAQLTRGDASDPGRHTRDEYDPF